MRYARFFCTFDIFGLGFGFGFGLGGEFLTVLDEASGFMLAIVASFYIEIRCRCSHGAGGGGIILGNS